MTKIKTNRRHKSSVDCNIIPVTGKSDPQCHNFPILGHSWNRMGGVGWNETDISEAIGWFLFLRILEGIWCCAAVAGGEAATATATTRGRMSVGRPHERRLAEQWCVAKPNLSDSAYQGVLAWVCGRLSGQGQVNCGPIQNGQSCYLPDSYQSHASWAMNAYYQAQGQSSQSCDFQGTATITTSNPSKIFSSFILEPCLCVFPLLSLACGFTLVTLLNILSSSSHQWVHSTL